MAYTNVWNDTIPTGSEAANTIDNIFRSVKVDLEQRFVDIFAMPNFTADPLRPYGLKFTDAQDAVISMGDNGGTPRNIIIKDKAGVTTYFTIGSTQITSAVNVQVPGLICLANGISSTGGLSVSAGTSALQAVTATTVTATSNLFAGSASGIGFTSRSVIQSTADGILTLTNNAGSSFTRLQLGGTTASFPSIKRSTTSIAFRLADDSGDAPISAALITGSNGITINGGTSALQAITGTTIVASSTITGTRLIGGTDVASATMYGIFGSGTYNGTNDAVITSILGSLTYYINSATNNTYIGAKSQFVQSAASGSTNSYATHSQLTATHTSGTLTTAVGNHGSVNMVASGGTTTDAIAIMAQSLIAAGHTVTTLTGIQVRIGLGISGTVTTAIGVDIKDITGASTNYSIRAGAGIVHICNASTGWLQIGSGINPGGFATAACLAISNTTAPGGDPIGGGFLYSQAGALKWHGSAGTNTTIAPA